MINRHTIQGFRDAVNSFPATVQERHDLIAKVENHRRN